MAFLPDSNEKPLSQASAKRKIWIGLIAGVFNLYLANQNEELKLAFLAGAFLIGYAIVGFIELALGVKLTEASKKWAELAGWKKFFISLAVIIVALIVFISLIPVFTKLLYG